MNIQQMIQAAQKAQRQYDKKHLEIEAKEYEFTANGAVKVVLKGTMEMVSIEFLDEDLLKDDPEMAIDMIRIAYNGCRDQIAADEDALQAEFQRQTGGMF